MRIALLGASGFVGSEFARQITERQFDLLKVGRKDCDLYNVKDLRKLLERLSPDAVVNCAGYTGKPNVDACESDKANCIAGNAVLPGVIDQACDELNIPWGHVSSGCIYTGSKQGGIGFDESDAPNFSFRQNNCSFYSGTKALGEEVLSTSSNCYVWRLRIPFSNVDSPRNYLSKLLHYDRLLEAENSLSDLTEFATAALDCIGKTLPFGIYNLTNPGFVSTTEVVSLIQNTLCPNRKFDFFNSEDQFMRLAAVAPRSNCILDSSKAIGLGLKLSPVRDALTRSLQNWVAESKEATKRKAL